MQGGDASRFLRFLGGRRWDSGDHQEAAARDVVEREGVGLVVFGHDGAQWKEWKKTPEYYE